MTLTDARNALAGRRVQPVDRRAGARRQTGHQPACVLGQRRRRARPPTRRPTDRARPRRTIRTSASDRGRSAPPRPSRVAAGAGAAVWGIGVERHLFTLRRATLPVLPAGSPDLKVLHLSDLHMAPWQRQQAALRPRARRPGAGPRRRHRRQPRPPDRPARAQGRARAVPRRPRRLRLGLERLLGAAARRTRSSTSRGPSGGGVREPDRLDTAALGAYLDSLGWTDLNNRTARLVVRGVPIDLLGTDDPHREYDDLAALSPGCAACARGR